MVTKVATETITLPRPSGNPHVQAAVIALALGAVGGIFLGLDLSNCHVLSLKEITHLSAIKAQNIEIATIVIGVGVGLDRGVVAIRYHHWKKDLPEKQNIERLLHEREEDIMFRITTYPSVHPPSGLCDIVYVALQRVVGSCVSLARWLPIDEAKFEEDKKNLEEAGYRVREVQLDRDGAIYQGFCVTKGTSDKWAIQAVGITGCAQKSLLAMARAYGELGFNLLIVNPPGVGKSRGMTTGRTLGEAQETGLQMLEHWGAKKIIVAGFSLGGGMMGRAITQHRFREDIKYLALFQMTFCSLSEAAGSLLGSGAKIATQLGGCDPISARVSALGIKIAIRCLGMEMDSVMAVKKLQKTKIPIIFVQTTEGEEGVLEPLSGAIRFSSDWIIRSRASLAFGAQKQALFHPEEILVYNPKRERVLPHDATPDETVKGPLLLVKARGGASFPFLF